MLEENILISIVILLMEVISREKSDAVGDPSIGLWLEPFLPYLAEHFSP